MTGEIQKGYEGAIIDALQPALDENKEAAYCKCKDCADTNGYISNTFNSLWMMHKVKPLAKDSKENLSNYFINQAKALTIGLKLNKGLATNVYLSLFVKLLEKHKIPFTDPGIQSITTLDATKAEPTLVPKDFSTHFARLLPPRSGLDTSRDPYLSHHYLCGAMETYYEARFAAPRQPGEPMDIILRHAHIPDLTPMCLAVYEPDGQKLVTGLQIYSPLTKGWSNGMSPVVLPNKTRMWQLQTVPLFTLVTPEGIPFVRILVSHFWQKTRVKRDVTIGVSFVACGCQRIPMEHRLD